jgi:DNA-binding transcriptional MerR regulator
MYKIKEIANIAGISSRTLRYYDEIDLLKPSFINSSNYRIYTDVELDILQQILFFRKLEISLAEIKTIISSRDFDFSETLISHKKNLMKQRSNINLLLETIDRTISYQKGEINMKPHEKFNGLKQQLIYDNELKYGKELRDTYGEDTMQATYAKFSNCSADDLKEADDIAQEILMILGALLKDQNPSSPEATKLCTLHEQWIKFYWTTYSKEAHLGLVRMYTEDDRFTAYYDKVGKGATIYLYEAMKVYLK